MAIRITSEAFEASHDHFHLHALDAEAMLPPGMNKDDLMSAAAGHLREEGDLVGTYQT